MARQKMSEHELFKFDMINMDFILGIVKFLEFEIILAGFTNSQTQKIIKTRKD